MLSVKVVALCFVALGMVAANGARAANPVVVMETNMGTIKIELDRSQGPGHGQELPRLRQGQVLRRHDFPSRHRWLHDPGRRLRARHEAEEDQGADQERIGQRPVQCQVHDRDGSYSDPDSATAQFFINVKDNKGLDGAPGQAGYAVFGKVIEGMDVVDKIKGVKTGTKAGFRDVPIDDVVIKSVKLVGDNEYCQN